MKATPDDVLRFLNEGHGNNLAIALYYMLAHGSHKEHVLALLDGREAEVKRLLNESILNDRNADQLAARAAYVLYRLFDQLAGPSLL